MKIKKKLKKKKVFLIFKAFSLNKNSKFPSYKLKEKKQNDSPLKQKPIFSIKINRLGEKDPKTSQDSKGSESMPFSPLKKLPKNDKEKS